jgi:hypothetical protein
MKKNFSKQNLIFLLVFFLYILLEIGRYFDHYFYGLIFPFLILIYGLFNKSIFMVKRNESFIFVVLIFLFYFISLSVIDFSFDGNAYHIPAIKHILSIGNTFSSDNLPSYIRSYPKNSWYIASALSFIFGSLNCSKIYNLISITLCYLMLNEFFLVYHDKFSGTLLWRKYLVYLSLLTTPVYLCQIFTNYNDYFLYLLLFTSFLGILVLLKQVNPILLISGFLACSISLAVKFNGLPLAISILFIYFFIAYKNKYYMLFTLFILVFFVQIYDPYLLNYINHQNIFYPLFSGNVDPIVFSSPWGLEHRSVPEFIRLIQVNFLEFGSAELIYKNPMTINLNEVKRFGRPDTIAGGFGIFGGFILCSFVAVAFNLLFRKHITHSVTYLLGLIISILYPGSSFARYSLLYPLIPLFLLFFYSDFVNKFLIKFIYILSAINLIISFVGFASYQILKEDRLNFLKQNKSLVLIGDKYFTPYFLDFENIKNIDHDRHGIFISGCYETKNLKFLPQKFTKLCDDRLL